MEPIGWVRTRFGLLRPVYPVRGGMGDWPLLGDGHRFEAGVDASLSTGRLITSSATANTKGSYAELIAATAFDAEGLMLYLGRQAAATQARWAVDFAVGAAASEVVIFPDLWMESVISDSIHRMVYVPIPVPAGTRIAARCACGLVGAQSMRAGVTLIGTGFLPSRVLGRATAYGFTTATTSGVQVDPGAVAHTKGAYSEIVASTANPIRQLIIALGYQGKLVAASVPWLIDVAVGAAGSEVILLPNIWATVNGNMDEFAYGHVGPFPVDIPAGTRIAMRAQCSTTSAGERTFETVLYGVD